jgi:hypothetical protein
VHLKLAQGEVDVVLDVVLEKELKQFTRIWAQSNARL